VDRSSRFAGCPIMFHALVQNTSSLIVSRNSSHWLSGYANGTQNATDASGPLIRSVQAFPVEDEGLLLESQSVHYTFNPCSGTSVWRRLLRELPLQQLRWYARKSAGRLDRLRRTHRYGREPTWLCRSSKVTESVLSRCRLRHQKETPKVEKL